jgi:hypothetical protein
VPVLGRVVLAGRGVGSAVRVVAGAVGVTVGAAAAGAVVVGVGGAVVAVLRGGASGTGRGVGAWLTTSRIAVTTATISTVATAALAITNDRGEPI